MHSIPAGVLLSRHPPSESGGKSEVLLQIDKQPRPLLFDELDGNKAAILQLKCGRTRSRHLPGALPDQRRAASGDTGRVLLFDHAVTLGLGELGPVGRNPQVSYSSRGPAAQSRYISEQRLWSVLTGVWRSTADVTIRCPTMSSKARATAAH